MKERDDLVEVMKKTGDAARRADLPEEAVRATRLRVAEILDGKNTMAARLSWRWAAWGWAAAASLCVTVVGLLFSHHLGGSIGLSSVNGVTGQTTVGQIDTEIDRIQKSLGYKISRFHARYTDGSPSRSFESRTRSVRARIQRHASGISAELRDQ